MHKLRYCTPSEQGARKKHLSSKDGTRELPKPCPINIGSFDNRCLLLTLTAACGLSTEVSQSLTQAEPLAECVTSQAFTDSTRFRSKFPRPWQRCWAHQCHTEGSGGCRCLGPMAGDGHHGQLPTPQMLECLMGLTVTHQSVLFAFKT